MQYLQKKNPVSSCLTSRIGLKLGLSFSLIVLFILPLAAQGSLILKNAGEFWFHYVLDPGELAAYTYTDPDFAGRVETYFKRPAADERFTALGPGQEQTLQTLTAGDHLLVGFFVIENKSAYPVKILNLQVFGGTSRHYTLHNTASNILIPRGEGMLRNFLPMNVGSDSIVREIKLDNNYTDWAAIPVTAGFSNETTPKVYYREQNGRRQTLAIENSLYWQQGGTQLEVFKALRDEFYFYFHVTSFGRITQDFILYFYLYPSRENVLTNTYALAFRAGMSNGEGSVQLWSPGGAPAVEIGSYVFTDRYLESRVELLLLPEELRYKFQEYSFDLATCFFNRADGMYEEFYFTTVYFRDIPDRIQLLPK